MFLERLCVDTTELAGVPVCWKRVVRARGVIPTTVYGYQGDLKTAAARLTSPANTVLQTRYRHFELSPLRPSRHAGAKSNARERNRC